MFERATTAQTKSFTQRKKELTMARKTTLALIAAALTFQLAMPPAADAADSQPGIYVWYVQRTASHSGRARRQLQTAGPFYTYESALAKKKHLDQNRSYGTFVYSTARIVRVVNPAFKSNQPVQPASQQSQFSQSRRR